MKISTIMSALLVGSTTAFSPQSHQSSRASVQLSETKDDLTTLGKALNPLVGYWDPLELADQAFWGQNEEFTVGFLRQAEVKHGRVAMAAFVGYIAQSNYVWPWAMTLDGQKFPGLDLTPPEQWDALPFYSKLQIVLFVGFLEWYSELTPGEGAETGQVHYTKGGQPGKFPTFDDVPHPVPYNLYDPFKLYTKQTEEQKATRLRVELNNGRLAMLGIIGFLSAQTIPGSVPLLTGVLKPYSGDVMAPFSADFSLLSS